MTVRGRAALVLFSMKGFAVGCTSSPPDERKPEVHCTRVRDKLVELELEPHAHARQTRAEVMRRALGREFVENCVRNLSVTEVECVLSATSSVAAHQCMSKATHP